MPKATAKRATVPGERMCTDILSPRVAVIGKKQYWLLCLDDASDYIFSFFVSHEDMLTFNLVPFVRKSRRNSILS